MVHRNKVRRPPNKIILGDMCGEDDFFTSLLFLYRNDPTISLTYIQNALSEISKKTDLHVYTLCMLFCLQYADFMKEDFKAKKIPQEIFISTIMDFKYKLIECHSRFGIWGTFVFGWYENIFRLHCFGIGRLEFEKIPLPFSFASEHIFLEQGSEVINIHIPSGSPLTMDACMDAFRRAYAFFVYTDIMPIFCHSWLLFPPYRNLYKTGSNLAEFFDLFTIVRSHNSKTFDDIWRVFDTENIDEINPHTSFQKNMLDYMKKTPIFGTSEAIALFNGKRIVNRVGG